MIKLKIFRAFFEKSGTFALNSIKMKIAIIAGARPNFIKVAPILRAVQNCKNERLNVKLVYTGSADDKTLEDSLFDDLQIARPDVFLGVDCENLNELTGKVMSAFEQYLHEFPTDAVIVVDDLASTMAVSIVTKKRGILLAHIAAGTRSFDITMPKEINRLVIDGLSDILFTAGLSNNSIANKEGAELSKVYMVGNILIDNIRFLQAFMHRSQLMEDMQLQDKQYLVFTLNRKAIIENHEKLFAMLEAVVNNAGHLPVIAPLRDLAKEIVESIAAEKQLDMSYFHIVEPQGYLDFSYLTAHAKGIITDSGNVAEEATFNQVPCITLNDYTEHIETVKVGTNVLVGEDANLLASSLKDILADRWKKADIPERWDGRTAERILQILLDA